MPSISELINCAPIDPPCPQDDGWELVEELTLAAWLCSQWAPAKSLSAKQRSRSFGSAPDCQTVTFGHDISSHIGAPVFVRVFVVGEVGHRPRMFQTRRTEGSVVGDSSAAAPLSQLQSEDRPPVASRVPRDGNLVMCRWNKLRMWYVKVRIIMRSLLSRYHHSLLALRFQRNSSIGCVGAGILSGVSLGATSHSPPKNSSTILLISPHVLGWRNLCCQHCVHCGNHRYHRHRHRHYHRHSH